MKGQTMVQLGQETGALLDRLGVDRALWNDGSMPSVTPLTGEQLGRVRVVDAAAIDETLGKASAAFRAWRHVPAPRRGELVRLWGEELRAAKDDLAKLVTIEAGKIPSEGAGEVQEMIDVCDFAVGLSRQLYGLTIATERPGHRMMEVWHPLGVVGVISAFNFPVAVWAWNAALALVCGNSVVWKPSEKTPLTALGVHAIFERALARFGDAPEGLAQLLVGGREAGESLVDDRRVALVSATGSTRMGRAVRTRDPRTRRQQRRDRRAVGRSRSRAAWCCLRRDGNGGATLHDDEAPVPARQYLRWLRRQAEDGLCERRRR
jgi:aldehyde dehydrogenase (NAD+)